jgi:cyclophilin family peptidyl-prolyl cis-trans isomerase/Flp pilus assembly protein TadD
MTTTRALIIVATSSVTVIAATAWYFNPRRSHPARVPQAAAERATPAAGGGLSSSLLEQMQAGPPDRGSGAAAGHAAPSNQQLEEAYALIDRVQRQIGGLKTEAAAADKAGDRNTAAQKLELARGEVSVLNGKLASLEGDLQRARAARPDDPTVQWLTGELLMLVGGEPGEILPYFEHAVHGGLQRPDALASLARVQLEANQFEPAYESALKALEMDPRNPDAWEMFGGVALANQRFAEVVRRLDEAYPQAKPPWAAVLRTHAHTLQDQWAAEEQIRHAEEAAGDLPRVRLTIEHQAFATGPDGRSQATPKATGRDEIELELFKHQAPATVANFLKLVERGFYDGTRFHWAEAASMVVGGDPLSKNNDPLDDGTGGPGYVIPDEFRLPGARLHFRGSVAMVESAAHTAGSQFFIELVPHPEMNHHLTVFGRVARGQEGVDRVTSGRTNQRFGRFGKTIPGDVLVRAVVIRK